MKNKKSYINNFTTYWAVKMLKLYAAYVKQLIFYKESLAIIGNFTTFAPKEIIDRIVTRHQSGRDGFANGKNPVLI